MSAPEPFVVMWWKTGDPMTRSVTRTFKSADEAERAFHAPFAGKVMMVHYLGRGIVAFWQRHGKATGPRRGRRSA